MATFDSNSVRETSLANSSSRQQVILAKMSKFDYIPQFLESSIKSNHNVSSFNIQLSIRQIKYLDHKLTLQNMCKTK